MLQHCIQARKEAETFTHKLKNHTKKGLHKVCSIEIIFAYISHYLHVRMGKVFACKMSL